AMVFFRRDGVAVLLALFAAAAQYELYQLLQKLGYRPFRNLGVTLGVLMILVPYFVHEYTEGAEEGLASALIAIAIVACCLRVMRERTGGDRMNTLITTTFGLIYMPYMLFFLVRIMWLDPAGAEGGGVPGMMLVVWLLCAAKFCDVGALL